MLEEEEVGENEESQNAVEPEEALAPHRAVTPTKVGSPALVHGINGGDTMPGVRQPGTLMTLTGGPKLQRSCPT